jgi:predicted phage replisome organizer
MADLKKYYYLKLKDNFYDSEELIILQNMQDGYLYSDILMKLYLRSLKNNGKIMFNDLIPYTPNVLSQVVRHQVGTVEKALNIFKQLGLIEILDNGAIYMTHIQNFIGQSSNEADRQRQYYNKIKEENNACKISYKNSTPEIEIEIELEKDIDVVDDINNNNINKLSVNSIRDDSTKYIEDIYTFICAMLVQKKCATSILLLNIFQS